MSPKRNQLLTVKLVTETVISAGCSNSIEGESPGLCPWRSLLHYLEATPLPASLLIPRAPPVSVPPVTSPPHGFHLSTARRSLPSSRGHVDFQHRGKEVFREGHTKPGRKEEGVQHFWGSELTGVAAGEIFPCSIQTAGVGSVPATQLTSSGLVTQFSSR